MPQSLLRPAPAPVPSLQVAPPGAFQPPGSQPLGSPSAPRPVVPAPAAAPELEPGQIITKAESQVRKVGTGADAHYVSKLTPEEKKRRRRRRTTVMFIVCLTALLITLVTVVKMKSRSHQEEGPAAPSLEL